MQTIYAHAFKIKDIIISFVNMLYIPHAFLDVIFMIINYLTTYIAIHGKSQNLINQKFLLKDPLVFPVLLSFV